MGSQSLTSSNDHKRHPVPPVCENLEFSLVMGSLASQSSHQTTVATQVVLKIQVLSAGSSPRLPTATPQNSFDMSLEMDWRVPTVVTVIPLVFRHARFYHWTLAHSRIIPTKQGCWIHHETPKTCSQCPNSNVAFVVIWKSDDIEKQWFKRQVYKTSIALELTYQ